MTAIANIDIGVSGHFTMIAHGGKRGRVVLAEFDNIILDAGREHSCSGSAVIGFCQVGTGTTTPTAGDTGLVAKIAHTSTLQGGVGNIFPGAYVSGSPPYIKGSLTYRFAVGAAAGNLSEVGIGWASSGSLWSRALIADSGGSPTTITILSDEQLDVVYELRVYPPTTDATGTATLGGVSYSYTLRANDVDNEWRYTTYQMLSGFVFGLGAGSGNATLQCFDGPIGSTITDTPSGASAGNNSSGVVNLASYSSGSYQRAAEFVAGLGDCNISGGIKSLVFSVPSSSGVGYGFSYQAQFSPNIPKDNTKVLKLTLTCTMSRRYP